MNKNYYAFRLFNYGQEDYRMGSLKPNLFDMAVFYRLGLLYEKSFGKPKRRRLIQELYREFAFCESELPNYCDIVLQETYSHRLLKKTMNSIGYAVPIRPDSSFHAWRYR